MTDTFHAKYAYKKQVRMRFIQDETKMKICRRCNPLKSLICRRLHQCLMRHHIFSFTLSVLMHIKVKQNLDLSLTGKTEEDCKLTHGPKTHQISELKNGKSLYCLCCYIFSVFLFVCLFLCFTSSKCILDTSR